MAKPKRRGGLGGAPLGTGGRGSDVETVLRLRSEARAPDRLALREVRPAELIPSRWQPRADFRAEELEGLAESIRAHGILEPLLARELPDGGGLELLAGERRLRAAELAGLEVVPVRLLEVESEAAAAAIALTENLAREDLSAWEEATGLATLRRTLEDAGEPAAVRALAELVGWSTGKVSERLTVAERISGAVLERAGVDVQTVNTLPATALLAAAQADEEGTRAALIYQAATGRLPEWYTPERLRTPRGSAAHRTRGRPPAPYTLQLPKDGRLALRVRDPAAIGEKEARDILERLRPFLEALQERAGLKQEDLTE